MLSVAANFSIFSINLMITFSDNKALPDQFAGSTPPIYWQLDLLCREKEGDVLYYRIPSVNTGDLMSA